MDLIFKECETCAAKPGAPILCAGCQHNRTVISRLLDQRAPRYRKMSPSGLHLKKDFKPLARPSGKIMGKQKREAKPE